MPRLACVTLVRNEIDILPAFLQHVAALFDDVVIMDHNSVDGTHETLCVAALEKPDWHIWRVTDPGYFQEAYCTFAMRWLFQNTAAEAVVFLDADEFIDIHTRKMLDAVVWTCCEQAFVGSLPWRNCLPEAPGAKVYHGCQHWRPSGKPQGSKIIIPRSVWNKYPQIRPGLGNHNAEIGTNAVPASPVGRLLHFPLRSVAQMKQKLVLGALSILAREDDIPRGRHHWFEALRRLAAEGLDEADMLGMAASYSEADAAFFRLPPNELAQCGFTKAALMVANEPLRIMVDVPESDPWEMVAAAIAEWRPAQRRIVAPRDVKLELNANRLVVHHG